jgi:hypothetical protein
MKIAIRNKSGSGESKDLTLITPKILSAAGRTLFGSLWQSPLAKALKVHDQVMRRWTNDGCPAMHAPTLDRLLRERAEEISQVLASLAAFDAAEK